MLRLSGFSHPRQERFGMERPFRPQASHPHLRLLSNRLSSIRRRSMIRPAQNFKRNMGLSLGL